MGESLDFPFPSPPAPGAWLEAAPGVFWARLPLPFRLDHVNVYLIDDGDGFALVDAGINSPPCREAWETLIAGPMRGRRLTRIIATHYHPDHIGLAGWLCERFSAPLIASETEYLVALTLLLAPGALQREPHRAFYRSHGLDEARTNLLLGTGLAYLRMVAPLPPTFRRVVAGETLRIGGREFAVLTGAGHSPEHVMLQCAEANLILAADQIMAKISPNISVEAMDPEGDPLGLYLGSLAALTRRLPDDVLVLSGHNLPFRGFRLRAAELEAHHRARCDAILTACADGPKTVAELVPVVFGRPIDDPHQFGFAFGEALAHVNLLVRRGALRFVEGADGIAATLA